MRQGSLSVLFALCLLAPTLQAQEPDSRSAPPVEAGLEQAPREAAPRQAEAEAEAEAASTAVTIEQAQLHRLREENQRLKALLRQQQAAPAPIASPLLNEQQQWFAVGGGVGVLGFLLGVLATRGRRRRQWLN